MLLWVVRPVILGLAARVPARAGEGIGSLGIDRPALGHATAQLSGENLAITQKDPERAARLVREWLKESSAATPPSRS